ncbi:MAG: fibrillarin-like rRNA/tRNA 2'-O-methyltransferase [Archaeoglobales archaeon]|jgi:fibrillarin-like pre-rRNA processing protein|nr:fibrillarin-like rRNA/tRNA 2'-O-methyltransferase [Archaeoglobales archaeon]TDA29327.1 MAG: fibrillarin-like rRNA/tRNA 2'-O-methyltransferase [Archaeoglobi archaeon]
MRNVKFFGNVPATKSRYGSHYGERIFEQDGERYREWIPWRSKLSAMLVKGYEIDLKGDEKVLYLGAASGTTLSHLADVVDEGVIYAVEYSAKPFKKLLELVRSRKNIIPIFGDASKPWKYSGIVEKVDLIYQDISQKNQVEILKLNSDFFLKSGGRILIMVKAKSIDSTAEAEQVFGNVLEELSKSFRILQSGRLDPFHKEHMFVLGERHSSAEWVKT